MAFNVDEIWSEAVHYKWWILGIGVPIGLYILWSSNAKSVAVATSPAEQSAQQLAAKVALNASNNALQAAQAQANAAVAAANIAANSGDTQAQAAAQAQVKETADQLAAVKAQYAANVKIANQSTGAGLAAVQSTNQAALSALALQTSANVQTNTANDNYMLAADQLGAGVDNTTTTAEQNVANTTTAAEQNVADTQTAAQVAVSNNALSTATLLQQQQQQAAAQQTFQGIVSQIASIVRGPFSLSAQLPAIRSANSVAQSGVSQLQNMPGATTYENDLLTIANELAYGATGAQGVNDASIISEVEQQAVSYGG